MECTSETIAFGGQQRVYKHASSTTQTDMEFSVFIPPQAHDGTKVPVLWYLSGLTCTQENVTTKAGFQRLASELGIMVICPDTSPRGEGVANDDAYDLGQGAGFYLNATKEPWARHFRMYDYITQEMQELVRRNFPADMNAQGITGHSMGGHGALTIGIRNAGIFKSISAFSPIVAPMQVPWGQKAFAAYLGEDTSRWSQYDACVLIQSAEDRSGFAEILIDQGLADNFLGDQLKPELFAAACKNVGQRLNLRKHEGYDHSYYFIASFVEDHLRHHAQYLT
ncbi:S-formylglutathione hydrolase [Kordiimonas aquimaris]|uniref:S-formylglutathione hydrolase n=1 Tax=Kordiimonas aquimaris TaxID=707591 RepID=UPI0021D3D1F6|nr:S-formylglutathione hydrolase [Kordiimonas aquimaris]